MKVIVLIDNRRENEALAIEHGLSLYVETAHHKCLVDVGLSDAFLSNAEKLRIDIADIDYLLLSHGHTDHVGGLSYFLNKNKKAQVIVSSKALSQKYFSKRHGLKDISPDFKLLEYLNRFQLISSNTVLEKDIRVCAQISHFLPTPKANAFLYKVSSYVGLELDDFKHEMVFCFGESELLISTGCAHHGLINILESVKTSYNLPVSHVVGGFHLIDSDEQNQFETNEEVNAIAHYLKKNYTNTEFYTGHCTGDKVMEILKEELGKKMHSFYTGLEIQIKNK